MDYDGSNQHQITRMGTIALSPRVSPDGSRLAFSALTKGGWDIMMFSLELNRPVSFPHLEERICRRRGPETGRSWHSRPRARANRTFMWRASGGNLHRMTSGKGPDVSPVWNRKTNAQIAFVGGRTGLPQIYTMEADGTNEQRMTDQGYAVSPNWAPNGQFLVVCMGS